MPGRGVGAGAAGVNAFGGALGGAAGARSTPRIQAQQPPSADDHGNWATLTNAQMDQLQRQMGQTGFEAGRTKRQGGRGATLTYVGTSKSYNVNKYLNTDGKDATHPDSGWIQRDPQGNYYGRLSIGNIKNTIGEMDRGMKPLPQTINATRVESMDMFLNTLKVGGAQHLDGLSKRDIMNMSPQDLAKTFTGLVKYNKGYTSVAVNESGIKMPDKGEVVCEYSILQGTKVIVTNNRAEMEAIVGRGYGQTVTSARIGNATFKDPNTGRSTTRRCLIANIAVIPGDQSRWWKVN